MREKNSVTTYSSHPHSEMFRYEHDFLKLVILIMSDEKTLNGLKK